MAAPAGTERSRPAASEPHQWKRGTAEHIHDATAGVAAAAPTEPAATPRAVFAEQGLMGLDGS